MAHEEYLRRNLLLARGLGVVANTEAALTRLKAGKRHPKWLRDALEGILERAETLPPALTAYRNAAPDTPTPTEDEQG